jgi:hypothetical protein
MQSLKLSLFNGSSLDHEGAQIQNCNVQSLEDVR